MRKHIAALGLAFVPLLAQSSESLEAGRRNYRLLCVQCHGEDGDAASYANIVPVAGIKRRYPPEVSARLSGSFSGRMLTGRERVELVEYMAELTGSKGFADPGWLTSPYLLEKKSQRIHEFRVLDVREEAAYAVGHVPNAVRVEAQGCGGDSEGTARWLGSLGVEPSTVVVVYDDEGGPAAACVWWRIRRAGHEWVSVLDGGWQRWQAERRFVSDSVARIPAAHYPVREPAGRGVDKANAVGRGVRWSWEDSVDTGGFRPQTEFAKLAKNAGLLPGGTFRWDGPEDQLAHLALTLGLLGYSVDWDSQARAIIVRTGA